MKHFFLIPGNADNECAKFTLLYRLATEIYGTKTFKHSHR